jgi:beta-xylosidase
MKFINSFLLIFIFMSINNATAQWVPDMENKKYKNPVIFADYSDPDLIRVGNDFYMVTSSFNCMPGIPVLHSRDLVNGKIIGHVYEKLTLEKYDKMVIYGLFQIFSCKSFLGRPLLLQQKLIFILTN